MRRNEIITELRARADAIREFGVTGLYLYGSAARDQMTAISDVDLFADVDYGRFGLVPFMDLREFLRSILGAQCRLHHAQCAASGTQGSNNSFRGHGIRQCNDR